MGRPHQGNLRASVSAESPESRHSSSRWNDVGSHLSPNRSVAQSQSHGSIGGRQGVSHINGGKLASSLLPGWRQGRMMKRMELSVFPLVALSVMCVLFFARASDRVHFGKSAKPAPTSKWSASLGLVDEEEQLLGVLGSLSAAKTHQYSKISLTSDVNSDVSSGHSTVLRGTGQGGGAAGVQQVEKGGGSAMNSGLNGPGKQVNSGEEVKLDTVDNASKSSDAVATLGTAEVELISAAGGPSSQEQIEQIPCETQAERNARLVRNNVRKAMRTIPLPVLSRAASQRLGVPCSGAWRWNVWQYFKARKWTRRTGADVKVGVEKVCGQIRSMVEDIKLPDEENELPLCKDDTAPALVAAAAPAAAQSGQQRNESNSTIGSGGHNWGHCWPNQQPFSPRVQRHLAELIQTSRQNASQRGLVGGIRWKFLVMSHTVEQLSKGKIHLTEAARLARYSNRILVLPRAGHSRLSLARANPVCNYLDLTPLVEHGVDWISPDIYLLLMSQFVPRRPSAAFMCLETKSLWRPCARYTEIASITEQIMAYSYWDLPIWNNMESFDLPWSPSIAPAKAQEAMRKWETKDVVVYMKTTPAMLGFSRPGNAILADSMFPYAQHLHAKVDRFVERLGWPFVALHFRSEFVVFTLGNMNKSDLIIDQMKGCTQQAALMAIRVATQIGAKSIFIAADIPYTPESVDGSNTTVRKTQRSESWKIMEWQFGRSRSLDIAEESLRYLRKRVPGSFMLDELDPTVNDLDSGEVAILDKLICAHADAFLAGVKMCGGYRAYDHDITRQRVHLHKTSASVFRWTGLDPK